jgi:hypothetical protein
MKLVRMDFCRHAGRLDLSLLIADPRSHAVVRGSVRKSRDCQPDLPVEREAPGQYRRRLGEVWAGAWELV